MVYYQCRFLLFTLCDKIDFRNMHYIMIHVLCVFVKCLSKEMSVFNVTNLYGFFACNNYKNLLVHS